MWHHCVLKVTPEGPRKQQWRKENIELNVTEYVTLLKQQSTKNTD